MKPAAPAGQEAATTGSGRQGAGGGLRSLAGDARRFLRGLRRNPLYSLVVIATLALSIGPGSAIFSLVDSLLLQPLPYADAERLVLVWQTNPKMGWFQRPVATGNFLDWQQRNRSFERLAALISIEANMTGSGRPERLSANLVSEDFFPALGTRAGVGRTFVPGEFTAGNDHVVLLSDGLWRRRFGADRQAIGRKVILNGEPYTVVGVTPPGFQFAEPVDLWFPLALDTLDSTNRTTGSLLAVGRLRPGVSLAEAQSDMDSISAALAQELPDTNAETGAGLIDLREQMVGELRPILYILIGAAVFVLLIGCANVTELMLTRTGARERELAVRVAMGGRRRDVVRPVLMESIAFGLAGGLLGLFLAMQLINIFVAMLPDVIPNVDRMGINVTVLGFTFLVSLLTGAAVGLVPALRFSRPDLARLLKGAGEKGSTGAGGSQRILRGLVVSEVALAMLLVVAAGLMTASFLELRRVDTGFDTANLLTFKLYVPADRYAENSRIAGFHEELQRRLQALPGVTGAAAVSHLPLGRTNATRTYVVEGRPLPEPGQYPRANYRVITPAFFRTLGISLIEGRDFSGQDTETSLPVVIISEQAARSIWPGESPLGKRLSLDPDNIVWAEVVGVVDDIKYRRLDEEAADCVYTPLRQTPVRELSWAVRAARGPESISRGVYQVIQDADRDLPLSELVTMESLVSQALVTRRLSAQLFAILAAVAFLMGVVGLYGVMSYSTTRRTQEIGLRMALGAKPREVLNLLVRQGMRLVGLGLLIGLALALTLGRLMESVLFGVSAVDPVTLVLASLLLAGVGVASILIASRRGVTVSPMVVMRGE